MSVPHASEIPLARRVMAYLAILGGYFFYCYNVLILEYVRPYLVQGYHMTLRDTALFYTSQSTAMTAGSIGAAWIVTRFGRKRTVAGITLLNGLLTIANLYFVGPAPWIVMRGLIGLVLGGYYVAAVSTMVSLFPPKYRARLAALNSAMFSAGEVLLGIVGAWVGEGSWSTLVWLGGIPPLFIAIAMWRLVPADNSYVAFGDETAAGLPAPRRASWFDMFRGPNTRLTLTCTFLAGLNFSGYQFFSGFLTTYLKMDRHLDAATMGFIYSLSGVGSLSGGFVWGYLADRAGRRLNGVGFLAAAVVVAVYLSAPPNLALLSILTLAYGFCLSCTYCWAVYFTELFPAPLRPMGAALFHAGHIVSAFAPSAVALTATPSSVAPGMWLAVPAFAAGALLWLTLPETMRGGILYRGYVPAPLRPAGDSGE